MRWTAKVTDPAAEMQLLICEGPDAGRALAFDGELILGRGEGSTAQLADTKVSRCHARFWRRRRKVLVEDLGSNNGTWHQIRLIEEEPVATACGPGSEQPVALRGAWGSVS